MASYANVYTFYNKDMREKHNKFLTRDKTFSDKNLMERTICTITVCFDFPASFAHFLASAVLFVTVNSASCGSVFTNIFIVF